MQKILGSALKREREMREISLEYIAQEMNISRRFLQALENEEFDQIHGDFYVRHYIRSYLRAVGADENDFLNRYHDYLNEMLKIPGNGQPDLYFDKIRFTKFRKRRLLLAAILLALLAAALLLFAPLNWRSGLAAMGRWSASPKPLALPASSQAVLTPDETLEPDFPALEVELHFARSCWARISRGTEILAERVFAPDETISVHGYELVLLLGDPAAVGLRVNGRPFPMTYRTGFGLRLVLNPASIPAEKPK
jgi:cytoskeletal protein RodZ